MKSRDKLGRRVVDKVHIETTNTETSRMTFAWLHQSITDITFTSKRTNSQCSQVNNQTQYTLLPNTYLLLVSG